MDIVIEVLFNLFQFAWNCLHVYELEFTSSEFVMRRSFFVVLVYVVYMSGVKIQFAIRYYLAIYSHR